MVELENETISDLGFNRSNTASPVNFHTKSDRSSGYFSSSPPTPTSPLSVSPPATLKRSTSSSFRLINRKISTASTCSQLSLPPQPPDDKLAAVIGWYPCFLLRVYCELFGLFFAVIFKRLPVIVPTLWISACLWLAGKLIEAGLSVARKILTLICAPLSGRNRIKRTVLVSGGSSVQSIYMARNFRSAGARVIVCEVAGEFPLAKFSTAVQKYYTVPKPDDRCINDYIESLKEIVAVEGVNYFIPVSESSSAYYDAVAKPHLEVLGCKCICPEVREVLLLNDLLELLKKTQSDGLATPHHYVIANAVELNRLYDLGIVKKEPHFMVSTGMEGCKNRVRVELPNTRRKLKFAHCISEQNPWLVVQDCRGEKYRTCTTVRESTVVCNVTCKANQSLGGVVATEKPEIERWIEQFFASLRGNFKIVGHFSFYFTLLRDGTVLLTDCQVGVKLPYVCYTSVQSRMLWKPCNHFSRHVSGPVVLANGGKYRLYKVLLGMMQRPSISIVWNALTVFGGRNEALFKVWDPLPYCAYYYVQLPLNTVYRVLSRLRDDKK